MSNYDSVASWEKNLLNLTRTFPSLQHCSLGPFGMCRGKGGRALGLEPGALTLALNLS